nr:hypothetical protein CFP56_01462 [Quercus suber]
MASLPVPPKPHVSSPADDVAYIVSHPRPRRSARPDLNHDRRRLSTSDWIDVDDSPQRSGRKTEKITRSPSSRQHRERTASLVDREEPSDLRSYFPRLSRILEGNESRTNIRSGSARVSEHRRHRDRNSTGRPRQRDESRSSLHRRPVRHRSAGLQSRRLESLHSANPSLLSVLTSLTATSERSSGSGSTITQSSYFRTGSDRSHTPKALAIPPVSKTTNLACDMSQPETLNVFDYMVQTDDSDDRSIGSASSSSSRYALSDVGSSDGPPTPSSRSTVPSPTTTRNVSIGRLGRKHDLPSAVSSSTIRSNSHSSEASERCIPRQRSMSDVMEECDEDEISDDDDNGGDDDDRESDDGDKGSTANSAASTHAPRPDHRSSSQSSQRSNSSSLHEFEMRRQHMGNTMQTSSHGHSAGATCEPQRSRSSSSRASGHDAYSAWQMAMQQYQYSSPSPAPSGDIPPVPYPFPHHISSLPTRPPVPDAPDLSRRTLTGYEQLALELASTSSPVQPIYRKFEYLNHRILLHLQDELSELEEQLRTIDEIIAQLEPTSMDISTQRSSSSRRGDTYSGAEIHHRRTNLLGRIFLKTEQYNRAMKSYSDMNRNFAAVNSEQVDLYRAWLTKHSPVHEVETRFLNQTPDLIVPGGTIPLRATRHPPQPVDEMSKWQAACATLPIALMLPVLLFSAIPSAMGRVLVVTLIAIGAFLTAATNPRLRALASVREWVVAGGLYVLVMAAVAGCVPGRT